MPDDINPETLRLLLTYDPETGLLFWKPRDVAFFPDRRAWASWTTSNCGKAALTAKTSGYKNGSILGKCGYRAHRVAWAIYFGEWPSFHVDHINGDRSDNRIANLREVTVSQNQMNRRLRTLLGKSSQYKGVYWRPARRRWVSEITAKGEHFRLGSFKTERDAAVAYNRKAEALFGPFARLNDV